MARALLHRPDWLFLDEATSALDQATEEHVAGLFADRLPGATIVSIAHRPAGDAAQDLVIELSPSDDGTTMRTTRLTGRGANGLAEPLAVPAAT